MISLISLVAGLLCAWQYLFGRERFSPLWLMVGLWLAAISVAQWRLSVYEAPWPLSFWAFLGLAAGAVSIGYWLTSLRLKRYGPPKDPQAAMIMSQWWWPAVLTVLTLLSLVANCYIALRFGTLPILSTIPDRLRFIINREVFGLWEYLALLPRLIIPLSWLYLVSARRQRWQTIVGSLVMTVGYFILVMYASRLVIIIATLMCYFIYLFVRRHQLTARRLLIASALLVTFVLAVSVAIPVLRQYITYRDYATDLDYNPFRYIFSLAELRIPESWAWVVPLYIIPAFNLQALMRAVSESGLTGIYHGGYMLSTLDPLMRILHLPESSLMFSWKELFLPWWVTATFLFAYVVDFGAIGAWAAAGIWGAALAGVYWWAGRRPSLTSIMLCAYASFVVIMTIYTNYLLRPEFYLDVIVIVGLGYLATITKASPKRSS